MSSKYGFERAKANIERYKLTGELDLITRTNYLREKVKNKTSFRTYLANFDLNYFNKIENNNQEQQYEEKSRILEESCKETYHAFNTKERGFKGRYQVAATLEMLEKNDYTYITRTNNARGIAKENIRPNKIEHIVKYSIKQQGFSTKNKNKMYRVCSDYIEQLCYGLNARKGSIQC